MKILSYFFSRDFSNTIHNCIPYITVELVLIADLSHAVYIEELPVFLRVSPILLNIKPGNQRLYLVSILKLFRLDRRRSFYLIDDLTNKTRKFIKGKRLKGKFFDSHGKDLFP